MVCHTNLQHPILEMKYELFLKNLILEPSQLEYITWKQTLPVGYKWRRDILVIKWNV